MNEKSKFKGKLHVELKDEFGNIKQIQDIPNTLTDLFDEHVAARLSNTNSSIISFMAIGSGTGQAASDTNLANLLSIIPLSGAIGSVSQGTGASDNDIVGIGYWEAGVGTGSISEAGLFRYSGTDLGSMAAYNDVISVQKGASDQLTITWTITCGSS